MREGYKDTPLGELPKNWNVNKIGEIVTFRKGKKVTLFDTKQDGYLPVIGASSFFGNYSQFSDDFNGVKCVPSDILMLWDGERSGLCATGHFGIIGSTVSKLMPVKGINSKYLYYHLQKDYKWIQKNRTGSGIPHVPSSLPSILWVAIPPLPEQQKIAEVLSTVDEKITVIDEQIGQSQELKKGLVQRLLTKGIGHSKFKSSSLGEIPDSWEVVKVGNVAKLQGGFAFKSNDAQEEGVRWLKIANVSVGKISWADNSFLPVGFEKKHLAFLLKAGDIVIAMTRPLLGNSLKIAKIKTEDEGCLLNQRVGRIIGTNKIELEFLYQVINSLGFITKMQKELLGTDPPNISSSMFEELEISLPPLSEQTKIAETLSTIDEKLEVLLEKKERYQELKIGLMQQLLTGKLRVNHMIDQLELA